jgi:hypothetical protein
MNRIFSMIVIRKLLSILCPLAIGASTAAYAHSVWIESKDNQLVIRFAEPGNDFETSPGYRVASARVRE